MHLLGDWGIALAVTGVFVDVNSTVQSSLWYFAVTYESVNKVRIHIDTL